MPPSATIGARLMQSFSRPARMPTSKNCGPRLRTCPATHARASGTSWPRHWLFWQAANPTLSPTLRRPITARYASLSALCPEKKSRKAGALPEAYGKATSYPAALGHDSVALSLSCMELGDSEYEASWTERMMCLLEELGAVPPRYDGSPHAHCRLAGQRTAARR